MSSAPEFESLRYEVSDGVATVTLNRPAALNALTMTMRRELQQVIDITDADDAVHAVIFTGAGRAYCAGFDLSSGGASFKADSAERLAAASVSGEVPGRDGGGMLTLRFFDSKKPLIGAINGAAVGIGASMLLPMDVRLASTQARFGFVFTRRGIVPDACASWFLPRVVGISRALEWTITGRLFPATEALAGGLVSEICEPEALLDRARAIAREIADNAAPVSVALTRQLMWRMLSADHPIEANRLESQALLARGASADAREGVSAFLEKRPAVFKCSVANDMPDFYPWWQQREY